MQAGNEAWRKAWERFNGGYGGPPDLNDDHSADRALFMALLVEEVRGELEADLAPRIASAAKRINAIDSGPPRVA